MGQEPFDIKDVFSKAMSRFSSAGGSGGSMMPDMNYSPDELRELVNEKKIEVLSIAIVLMAVYGAYMMYDSRTKEINGIQLQIQLLEGKEKPAQEYQKIMEENKAYMSSLPSAVSENKFISEMTAWAGRRGIRIKSFEPPKTKTGGFYRSTYMKVFCSADSFYVALLFLSDIERSPYAIKVDSFNAAANLSSFQDAGFARKTEKKNLDGSVSPEIDMDLLIVSEELLEKEEDKDKGKNVKK